MAAGRIVLPPYFPTRDADGCPVSGAKLYVYQNNTTTLVGVYSDDALSIPISNPVLANASGQFPSIWAEAGTEGAPVLYSIAVTTADGSAPGRPSVFDDYRPSVDFETATLALVEAYAGQVSTDAASAAASAVAADSSADSSEAAYQEILDFAASSPESPSIVNKVNLDGDNIPDAAVFRTAIGAQAETFALPAVAGATPSLRTMSARLLAGLELYAADYGVVAGVSGAASTNTATINALMAYIGNAGGGSLILPRGLVYISATLDNKYPGVLVTGYMRSRFHDAGTPVFGTTIVPTGAFTALKHRTPFASEVGGPASAIAKNTGGGFVNMRVIGNGVSPRLLEVNTVACATYDLYLESAFGTGEAAYFTAGITGSDIGEAADVQNCSIHLNIRQIDTGSDSANCVVFAGSTNANVSLNADVRIFAQHKNGHALFIRSADNNDIDLTATRVSGGTGKTVQIGDAAAYDSNIGGNTFIHLSGNGGGNILGTDTPSGIANFATVLNYDNGNGSPVLTAGTASGWVKLSDTFGVSSGMASGPMAFGADATQAIAARLGLGVATQYIRNGSSSHAIYDDPSGNKWAVRIDGSNGNFEFIRLGGTGALNLPDVSGLKFGGSQVSVGAPDSAGAGFRTLRLPN